MPEIEEIEDFQLLTALYRDYCFMTEAYLLEACHLVYIQTREYPKAKEVLPEKLAVPLYYLANKIEA